MRFLFTLPFLFLLTISSTIAQSNVSFRLTTEDYSVDAKSTTVSVQIKAEDNAVNLADQYYRFYYDASNMKLNDFNIETSLPGALYYDAQVVEHISGFDASEVGLLEYDKNLGFINLFIELSDLTSGGTIIRRQDGWVTVATVEFDIHNTLNPVYATWARESKTSAYASAFALISEWIQPQVVEMLHHTDFNDLYATAIKKSNIDAINIKVGPNPTSDYVKIDSNKRFADDAVITLTDLNGSTINAQYAGGSSEVIIDLQNLSSGTYIVEVNNGPESEKIIEKIIFTRS